MKITIDLDKILPADVNVLSTLFFIGMFGLAMVIICLLARIIMGKNSSLIHATSSALGILCIYAVSIVVYTFNPNNLSRYLSPLPFVGFAEDKLVLFSFRNSDFPTICYQLLSMLVLAFLVNLLDDHFPKGTRLLGWFLFRFLSVLAAMALHYIVNQFIGIFIPGVLENDAPMILLCIFVFMLSLGFLKNILALFLITVHPLLAALYAFFFSSKVGKQISRAVLSTILICAFFLILEYTGYSVIPISAAALNSYVPLAVCLMVLWFLVGMML